MEELRIVKKLVGDEYIQCKMIEIKKGDRFTLHEPDGTPVGAGEFIAEEDATIKDGIAGVIVKS